MRIIYLLDASMDITGAFVSARNIAIALQPSVGVVLVLPEGSRVPQAELSSFHRVLYVPMVNPQKSLRHLWHYLPVLLRATRQIYSAMRQDGATHLLSNDFYLLQGAALRLMGFRGRLLVWVRCHPKRFAGAFAKPLLWLQALVANQIVVVSRYIQKQMPPGVRASLLYEGIVASPASARALQGHKQCVYIANYIEGKGQALALQAFAIAAGQNEALRLAFYGGTLGLEKNREYRQNLEKMAQQLGLSEKVAFHDFCKEVIPVLQQALAALNFSQSESFSFTVLEAQAAGVPVIATDSGGPAEIIEEGKTGFVIPLYSAEIAAQKMLALAEDPALAEAMGRAAAIRITTHFSAERFQQNLYSLLQI